ncbi:hypothetical protein SBOR_7874 [Sclerotinia borealis F-4128]|uniref:Uncharacterized protein n=1 Tax=Sclerotinia borealis (strain F-4128) TaxID=1432307 RepID=W9C7H6_SCLBF|nr:hypothetical protein SBOR_7874 [Sclerotinia borealis F-4128]
MVDTTLPFRLFPTTPEELARLYLPIELRVLVHQWTGLGDRYHYLNVEFHWQKFKEDYTVAEGPAIFLSNSLCLDQQGRFMGLGHRIGRYEDYAFTKEREHPIIIREEDEPKIPIWLNTERDEDEGPPIYPFKTCQLPYPFDMGTAWAREAKRIIVESIELAPNKRSWIKHWEVCNVWKWNRSYFLYQWDSCHADIALDAFSEWSIMVGL